MPMCERCGASFIDRGRRATPQRFCSKTCSALAHTHVSRRNAAIATQVMRDRHPGRYIRVEVSCSQCGKRFAIKAALVPRIKTCSKVCSNARKSTS